MTGGKTSIRRGTTAGRVVPGLCLLILVAGIVGPYLAPFDPWGSTGAPFEPPGRIHWLGTNDLGQDVLSEVLHGISGSLMVGLVAAALATAIGSGVGLLAGSLRGIADDVLMLITDLLLVIPGLPLIIVMVAYLGPGTGSVVLAIGLTWWPATARAVRARALQLREMPFVEAARATGLGECRVIVRHLLRNAAPVIAARFVAAVPDAILAEAGLSFLGLGDPSRKSLGMMTNFAFRGGAFLNEQWWWFAPPILAIALVVMAVALGSDRWADGRLRGFRFRRAGASIAG